MDQTEDRVRRMSPKKANKEIDEVTLKSIAVYKSNPHEIGKRIHELNDEYDLDRAVVLNFVIVGGAGLALGAFLNIWWLLLPGIQIPFLAYHMIKGWCPPAPVFRLLKYRTRQEIEKEKYALKLIRGDFNNLQSSSPEAIFEAVKKN